MQFFSDKHLPIQLKKIYPMHIFVLKNVYYEWSYGRCKCDGYEKNNSGSLQCALIGVQVNSMFSALFLTVAVRLHTQKAESTDSLCRMLSSSSSDSFSSLQT